MLSIMRPITKSKSLPNMLQVKPEVNCVRSSPEDWSPLSDETQPWTGKVGICDSLPQESLLKWVNNQTFDAAQSRAQWIMDNPSVAKCWDNFLKILLIAYRQDLRFVMRMRLNIDAVYAMGRHHHSKGYDHIHYFRDNRIPISQIIDAPYAEKVSVDDQGFLAQCGGDVLFCGEPRRYAHHLRRLFYRSVQGALEAIMKPVLSNFSDQEFADILRLHHKKLAAQGWHPEQCIRNKSFLDDLYRQVKLREQQN